ncbi:MAG: hypothetical protein AAB873_01585 [Patescibacteria group bacterium]
MLLRILSSVAILLSLLFMPFWVSILLALAGMVYFAFYWEAVALFFISDLLYGVREERFFNFLIISTIVSFFTLLIIEYLKKKLHIRV